MKGSEIFTLTKQILGGGTGEYPLAESLFYSLLNIAQINIENMRNWMVLRSTDKSLTAQAGNNWDTGLSLPTNFRKLTDDGVIRLYDTSGHKIKIYEVPMEKQLEYKDKFGYFSIDYSERKLYIYGNVPQSYTIWIPYNIANDLITENTSWNKFSSPQDFSSILAFNVAAMHRGGIDYDDQNSRASTRNVFDENAILSAMTAWDSSLQLSSVTHEDYTEEE